MVTFAFDTAIGASEEVKRVTVAPKVATKRRTIRNHTAFHRMKCPNLVVQSKTELKYIFTFKIVCLILVLDISFREAGMKTTWAKPGKNDL